MGFGHCEPPRADASALVGQMSASDARPRGLTEREREVLCRITDGQSNRQIAKALHITPSTARTHAHNVLVKLGVRSRIQAAALAAPVPEPALPDPASDADRLATLTPREHDVLGCILEGLARTAIADRLNLSVHTVRTHARNLLAKLDVHSTLEATALVRRVSDRRTL